MLPPVLTVSILQLLVGAVAGHAIPAVLAAAEINSFSFRCLVLLWREFAAFVTAIAKGLSGALAACAVPIALARFNCDGKG